MDSAADILDTSALATVGNGPSRHDGATIALHWLTVILVVANFALAEVWDRFVRPTRHVMIVTHMSFGVLLAAVVAARILWRLRPGRQTLGARPGASGFAAAAIHSLLYALLALVVVLGFARRWSGGQAMPFFGLLIPSPIAEMSRTTRHLIGEAHSWVGWAIVIIATGHAAAALYHHLVIKDDALRRMLPGHTRS